MFQLHLLNLLIGHLFDPLDLGLLALKCLIRLRRLWLALTANTPAALFGSAPVIVLRV